MIRGSHSASAERVVTLRRVFDAPRSLVFSAWSRPEHLVRWWGPRGFTLATCEMDFRPGGAWRFVVRGPDGKDYPARGVYREIIEPEQIVFTAILDDDPGDELVTSVMFAEQGGKTELTVHQTTPRAESAARGQEQGWTQSLDRLAESLTEGTIMAGMAGRASS